MQPFKFRETLELSKLDPRFPEGHVWTFWATPTAAVLADTLAPLEETEAVDEGRTVSEDAMTAAMERFYRGVSELVLDTGATGLDLSTPDRVRAVFEDETQDRELIAGIVDQFAYRVRQKRIDAAKKAIGGLEPTAASSSKSATD